MTYAIIGGIIILILILSVDDRIEIEKVLENEIKNKLHKIKISFYSHPTNSTNYIKAKIGKIIFEINKSITYDYYDVFINNKYIIFSCNEYFYDTLYEEYLRRETEKIIKLVKGK